MIPDILRHVPRKGENLMFNEKKLDELATRMKEKEISIPTDLAGSILFFLLGAVLFFMLPSQVPISENDVINGRVFPKLLFSLMMICSAVLIIQNIIKISKKQPVQVSTFNLLTEVKALMILTILLSLISSAGSRICLFWEQFSAPLRSLSISAAKNGPTMRSPSEWPCSSGRHSVSV